MLQKHHSLTPGWQALNIRLKLKPAKSKMEKKKKCTYGSNHIHEKKKLMSIDLQSGNDSLRRCYGRIQENHIPGKNN